MKKLSKEAAKRMKCLAKEYDITDEAGICLLQKMGEADDLFYDCEKIVQTEGLTIKGDRGGSKAHPLLSVMRDCRSQFLMALKMLNLDLEPLRDGRGRPPGR